MPARSFDETDDDTNDIELERLIAEPSVPLPSRQIRCPRNPSSAPPASSSNGRWSMTCRVMVGLVGLSILASHWVAPILLPQDIGAGSSDHLKAPPSDLGHESMSLKPRSEGTAAEATTAFRPKTHDARLGLSCPVRSSTTAEEDSSDDERHRWYDSTSTDISDHASEYLTIFQQVEDYDSWGHSYDEMKRGMQHFKKQYILPHLKDTMSIYETASHMGLNLYMTLETVKQEVQRLVIYGSESSADSVRVANQLLGSAELPGHAEFGLICQADPTNLSFVPDNTMDLVMTGYMAPLSDPLGLGIENTDERFSRYAELCSAKQDVDPGEYKLNSEAQHKQNSWYRSQVDEMIRIAKPGALIVVEHVSYPLCEALYDGGGVYQYFWKANAETEEWNIDAESIEFVKDDVFRNRYHVVMRKKK